MNNNDFFMSAYGVRIPRIIYGTAWKKDRTASYVEQAIMLGFRGIDTACQPKHYNEVGVGDGVTATLQRGVNRADLYLQSKFTSVNGQDPRCIPYDPQSSLNDQVAQSFQVSLRNLQTTYLDCLILHSPLAYPSQTQEVWQAMERIFDDGGTKQLGISNCYNPAQFEWLHRIAKVKPAVLQNRFYADTQYDHSLRAYCQKYQIIYQSFWTLSANPGILSHHILGKLMRKYQRSAAQIFFRYLTQINIIPLMGTTTVTHMQEDLAIFSFKLTTDECETVGALLM
ncbi:Aldo/keto reductase [Gammaproteobacteria bacterium]